MVTLMERRSRHWSELELCDRIVSFRVLIRLKQTQFGAENMIRCLGALLAFGIINGCNTLSNKRESNQSRRFSGLIGTCRVVKEDLRIDLCFEYRYDVESNRDPKEDSIRSLQKSCEAQNPSNSLKVGWMTDGTCSMNSAGWVCNANATENQSAGILKLVIAGGGASEENAKTLCRTYKGSLEAINQGTANQPKQSICSTDLGNGYVSYELHAPSESKVRRWFIIRGDTIHDKFDDAITYDAAVGRWKNGFYLSNLRLEDSVVIEVDGKQTTSTIEALVANRCD